MQRVIVIGSPGAGKTTFAVNLSQLTGLPVVHLDKLFWNSGWVESRPEDFDKKLASELNKPRWIIDGSYTRTLAMRLAECDTVVFLDYPAALCMLSVLWRRIVYNGRVRFDMPEGCVEAIDRDFLRYIAEFPGKHRKSFLHIPAEYPEINFYAPRSRRQARKLLERLAQEGV